MKWIFRGGSIEAKRKNNTEKCSLVSSVSETEKEIMNVQDDILANYLVATCIFEFLFFPLTLYINTYYNIEYFKHSHAVISQSFILTSCTLALIARFFWSPKLGYHIFTIAMTMSLLLYANRITSLSMDPLMSKMLKSLTLYSQIEC